MFKVIISETIYAKISAAEEVKPAQTRSYLYKLMTQQQVQRLTSEETAHLRSHPEEVLKNPSSLYILDITPTEALGIQKNMGVLCLSGDSPDITPLIDINDIHVPQQQMMSGRGWDSVLDSIEPLPSNALLLTDRYLFTKRNKDAGDGLANVYSILRELLPQQFSGGDYHVTIVFCDDKKHGSYTFTEIATKLYNITQQMGRYYPIMMEVFGIAEGSSIYDMLHSRRIVSNYYLVEASHKLAAFNHNLGTVQQTLIPMTLFTESSLNGIGSSPLDSINQTIQSFQDFYNKILSRPDKSIDYLYAVNGKRMERCMKIRNRLIM